jgi:DNA-binding IclR family transcriptional regulator
MRLPANCAASGKAMMSSLPVEYVTDLALARAFYSLTRKSVTRTAPLLEQLRQARLLGYAVDDEETRHGMVCIGAAVFSAASDEAVAAVAVSMPKSMLNPDRKALAIQTVRHLADHISKRLGARRADARSASG